MCKEIVDKLFKPKQEVKPIQPFVPQIPVPEWRRREQERLSREALKHSREQYGIGTRAGGVVYTNIDQIAQDQPIPGKSDESGILPEIKTVDKTLPSKSKTPRDGWGEGHR